jgi:hypothetical protein
MSIPQAAIQRVPLPVLEVAASAPWMTDDYNLNGYEAVRRGHEATDLSTGMTCVYIYRDEPGADRLIEGFDLADVTKIAPHLPAWATRATKGSIEVNQHAHHSIRQFICNVQHQWNLHISRMEALPAYQRAIYAEDIGGAA